MEIWLDTTDEACITDAIKRGLLHGITTNPTSVSHSEKPLEDLLKELLDIQDGPVAVQVVADSREEMIRQAELLTAHSPRVIVKVPVTSQGLISIYELSSRRIPVMATALFEPYQALLAFKAGAHYVAPYLRKIQDAGGSFKTTLLLMQKLIATYSFDSKIIAASIPNLETLLFCAEIGLSAATIPATIYKDLVSDHPATVRATVKFSEDWQEAPQSSIIPN